LEKNHPRQRCFALKSHDSSSIIAFEGFNL